MRCFRFWIICLAAIFITGNVSAQTASSPDAPETGVVLKELSVPVYPPLARQAAIVGEVKIQLGIRQDGAVASATLISGHPMLEQAALDSARQSQFECQGCRSEVTPYELVYTFRLPESQCNQQSHTKVTHIQNHITIDDVRPMECDVESFGLKKVRSVKCLYFWKCSVRIRIWHSQP